MGKLPRKEIYAYRKMVKNQRKKLVKLAKEWSPYDWSFTTEMFIEGIKCIKEYYEQNNNVWSIEYEDGPTRVEICDYIINKFNDFYEAEWKDEDCRWDELWRLVAGYLRWLWD